MPCAGRPLMWKGCAGRPLRRKGEIRCSCVRCFHLSYPPSRCCSARGGRPAVRHTTRWIDVQAGSAGAARAPGCAALCPTGSSVCEAIIPYPTSNVKHPDADGHAGSAQNQGGRTINVRSVYASLDIGWVMCYLEPGQHLRNPVIGDRLRTRRHAAIDLVSGGQRAF